MTGGSVEGVDDEPPLPCPLDDDEDDELLLEEELPLDAADEDAPLEPPPDDTGDGVAITAGVVAAVGGGETASRRGAESRLAAFELAIEPTATPNASIPITAIAEARGVGIERDAIEGPAAVSTAPEAAGPPMTDPRGGAESPPGASIASIRSEIR